MSSTNNARTPVIDWDSAPEGFPVWIEDLLPFGESTSCWAKDEGSYFLGINGSKWDKPEGIAFAAHYPTPSSVMPAAQPGSHVITLTERDKADIDAHIRTSAEALVGEEMAREVFPGAFIGEPFHPPQPKWVVAPADATHALARYDQIVWLKLGKGLEPAYRWNDFTGDWVSAHADSAQALGSEYIVARPAPAEKWSLDGLDGNWNYDTLAELIIDCYGHDSDGDGHPASFVSGLYEGDTIYRATPHFDDPVRFLPEASDVLDHMADATSDSDASEYADNYPDVDDEARAALEVALEPLKAWARKHCQPDFFTVAGIKPYILTTEDVQAAKAQERAR